MQQLETRLISVIIPVYNGANYLREAIDSVLGQTLHDYELIVVDDGSTDNTSAIAVSYGSRLTYLHQENQGVAAALNHGILSAQGKYIAWLSHDDVFMPNKLERQVDFLRRFPEYRACYTDLYVIDAQGIVTEEVEKPWYPRQRVIRMLFREMYINGCTMLIERACFAEVGLFNEQLRYTQDAEMWFRMLRRFEIGRVPEKLLKSRIHSDQGTQNRKGSLNAEALAMYQQVFEDLGVAGVFPELAESADAPHVIAGAYEWFGDTMASSPRRLYTFADEQYRRSVALWPSWRNLARLKAAIGAKCLHLPTRLYRRVRHTFGAKY